MRRELGVRAIETGLMVAGLAAVLLWMKASESAPRPTHAMAVGEDSDTGPSIQHAENSA